MKSCLYHPGVVKHFSNGKSVVNVAIEHGADEVNAVLRKRKEGDAEWVVKDLVDVVEGILFVDDRVEENTQSPDILFLATIRPAL